MIRLGAWVDGRLRRHLAAKMARRARGMLAMLLAVQFLAGGLCALPAAQAGDAMPSTVMPQAAMHADCPMDMPAAPDQSLPQCDHCDEPEAAVVSTPAPEAPVWALAAVLPDIRLLGDTPADTPAHALARLAPLSAPPDSASLIFRQTLRIRI